MLLNKRAEHVKSSGTEVRNKMVNQADEITEIQQWMFLYAEWKCEWSSKEECRTSNGECLKLTKFYDFPNGIPFRRKSSAVQMRVPRTKTTVLIENCVRAVFSILHFAEVILFMKQNRKRPSRTNNFEWRCGFALIEVWITRSMDSKSN